MIEQIITIKFSIFRGKKFKILLIKNIIQTHKKYSVADLYSIIIIWNTRSLFYNNCLEHHFLLLFINYITNCIFSHDITTLYYIHMLVNSIRGQQKLISIQIQTRFVQQIEKKSYNLQKTPADGQEDTHSNTSLLMKLAVQFVHLY